MVVVFPSRLSDSGRQRTKSGRCPIRLPIGVWRRATGVTRLVFNAAPLLVFSPSSDRYIVIVVAVTVITNFPSGVYAQRIPALPDIPYVAITSKLDQPSSLARCRHPNTHDLLSDVITVIIVLWRSVGCPHTSTTFVPTTRVPLLPLPLPLPLLLLLLLPRGRGGLRGRSRAGFKIVFPE